MTGGSELSADMGKRALFGARFRLSFPGAERSGFGRNGVRLRGDPPEEQIRSELMAAADFFDEVKEQYFADSPEFCERSWGMSHDYPIAVECRSTIVRVGTTIFGERKY